MLLPPDSDEGGKESAVEAEVGAEEVEDEKEPLPPNSAGGKKIEFE